MASISEAVRTRFSSTCAESQKAYQRWQASHLYLPAHLQHEFCLQTTFVQFVYAYFLRICEEYGLLPPFPTDKQESKTWLNNSMQTALHILKNPDYGTSASIARCFDWFSLDEHTMLQLYQLLKQHNFAARHDDIAGKVYNESFVEQHNRSEKGQFYTPPHIVDYMLDTLDIPALHGTNDIKVDGYTKCRTFLNKTFADLSCGSGAFLVSASARKRTILQHLIAAGEIKQEHALDILTGTIVGFDLDPFACYLATINLLIQCLPFLLDEHGQVSKRIAQFHIYCADALDPCSMQQASFSARKFDYLLGNPPYVSANESSSNLLYRNKIGSSGYYRLLNQKWDLFVPFFERNLQLLQPESGRLGLIVSSGIETEGYAQRLRQVLCERYSLLQIDFFPGLRVFPPTGVESTMVFLENRLPTETQRVTRRRHLRANLSSFETLPPARQLTEVKQVFRWRYLPVLATSMANESIPLCAIAYIGTGIEAQSRELSEQVIDGQRHKRFTLYDVFILPANDNERLAGFLDYGVLGDDVDNYHLRRTRAVAYEQYRPHMRGPRHSALFHTPAKLLLGETSGGYYDTGGLFANHSVQVVVPWHALAQSSALHETGIQRVLRKSQQISGITELPQTSERFDLRYILAIINSRFIRRYIAANMHEGTRKDRIYPDVWKRLPIKIVPLERQKQLALLVEAVQDEYKTPSRSAETGNGDSSTKVHRLVDKIERLVEEIYEKNLISGQQMTPFHGNLCRDAIDHILNEF